MPVMGARFTELRTQALQVSKLVLPKRLVAVAGKASTNLMGLKRPAVGTGTP
jgi:hypothetical protein